MGHGLCALWGDAISGGASSAARACPRSLLRRLPSLRSPARRSVVSLSLFVHNCLCTDKEHRLSRWVVGREAASTWRAFHERALEVAAGALATLTCRGRSLRTRGIKTKSVTP